MLTLFAATVYGGVKLIQEGGFISTAVGIVLIVSYFAGGAMMYLFANSIAQHQATIKKYREEKKDEGICP